MFAESNTRVRALVTAWLVFKRDPQRRVRRSRSSLC
jgi:hypothetical protein